MLEGDPETQGQFQAALHSATVFMPGRERTKTNNIKLVQEMRVAYNEFGRRRVADGTFRKVNDFGLLTRAELDEAVRYVHDRKKRAYLAVNSFVKNRDLPDVRHDPVTACLHVASHDVP